MDRLWSPWRYKYVSTAQPTDECIFCAKSRANRDAENFIVHRGEHNFVILNAFPYTSGHLMVAPYRHGSTLDSLDDAEALEVHRLAAAGIEALRAVYGPEGFNVGWNLGRIAGAGIADHGHAHVVPRWSGDTTFMPVLADVRVLPEHLAASRRKLADAWPARG